MTTDRMFDVDRKDQGEHLVIVRPTQPVANDWARSLIGELSKDTALATRIAVSASAIADGSPTNPARDATIARLAVMIRRAARIELDNDEATLLIEDIDQAQTTPLPCEAPDCEAPEHSLGLCWDHWLAQETAVAAKTTKAPAYAGGGSECRSCGEDRCACGMGGVWS